MAPLVSPQGLAKLKEHNYIYHNASPIEKILSKEVWERAVKLVPLWVAPNTITLVGFSAMVISYIPFMCYDLSLTKEVPNWFFTVAAFLHLFYQTADGCDGKQARRTKSSSPLGHMFDHGCDAFSASFYLLCVFQAFQIGDNYVTVFLLFVFALFIFWLWMWNQTHTHILLQHFSGVGVVEAQILLFVVLLLTGIFGQSIWQKPIADFVPSLLKNFLPAHPIVETVLNTPFKLPFLYALVALLAIFITKTLVDTVSATRSKASILKENIPFVHLMILFAIWSQTSFCMKYHALVFLIFGTHFSLITARLIIHGVTEDPFPIYHHELFVLTGLTPFLFKDMFFPQMKLPFPEDTTFLILVGFLTLFSMLKWTVQIMTEISEHLGIRCFSIDPPDFSEPNSSSIAPTPIKIKRN